MKAIPAVWKTKLTGVAEANVPGAVALCNQARANKANVIEGATTVEQELVAIIAHYFFGEKGAPVGMYDEFRETILETSWCTFDAKRRLVTSILKKKGVAQEKDIKDYEQLLFNVIRYRNAFTHGEISSDGKDAFIEYYKDGRKRETLTDDYLEKVEKTLSNGYHHTHDFAKKLGVVKTAGGEPS
jgi:hypothetical protein